MAFGTVEKSYVLERLYASIREGEQFAYGHQSSEMSTNLYDALGAGSEQQQQILSTLDPSPQSRPFSQMHYRIFFHLALANDSHFLERLSHKTISQERYFRDTEKVSRISFYERVESRDMAASIDNETLQRHATEHAKQFAQLYFSGMSTTAIAAHIIGCDHHKPEHAAWLQKIRSAIWAVDVAFPYLENLIGAPVHASELVASERINQAHSYNTRELNILFEAAFHFSRHITVQVLPHQEQYGVSQTVIKKVVGEEISAVGQTQRNSGMITPPITIDLIQTLMQNGIAEHEPALLYNLFDRCTEIRSRQKQDSQAMQETLKEINALFEEPEEDEQLRDKDQEFQIDIPASAQKLNQLDERGNEAAIDAAETIIEYFKNIQFGDKSAEQALDMDSEQALEESATGDSSSGNTSNKKSKVQFEVQDMEFEVSVEGQAKKKMKLSQIMSSLRAGNNVRFASKAQAKNFAKGAMSVAKDEPLGFSMGQLQYKSRGGSEQSLEGEIELENPKDIKKGSKVLEAMEEQQEEQLQKQKLGVRKSSRMESIKDQKQLTDKEHTQTLMSDAKDIKLQETPKAKEPPSQEVGRGA